MRTSILGSLRDLQYIFAVIYETLCTKRILLHHFKPVLYDDHVIKGSLYSAPGLPRVPANPREAPQTGSRQSGTARGRGSWRALAVVSTMVLILDGAHVRSNVCYLIC